MLARLSVWLPLGLVVALTTLGACGSDATGSGGFGHTTSGTSMSSNAGGGGGTSTNSFVGSTGAQGGTSGQSLDVTPTALQTITVQVGQHTPTVTYKAKLDGNPVNAGWAVDRGEIGTMPAASASTADFTPSGAVGGYVSVTAGLKIGGTKYSAQRDILVKLTSTQNGPNSSPQEQPQIATDPTQLTAGGGVGGVGGDGLGGTVTDATTQAALSGPTDDGSGQNLKWLYPYDKTVFPRGILAPLLMWNWSIGDADAIQISLKTKSGSYSYTGMFSKPPILMLTGGKFIRMPIPQDAWEQATNSAGGTLPDGTPDTLSIELVVASGGVGHGPIKQTWKVAPARLSGIIYYNSYGTQLAKNLGGAVGGDHMFGGAVLSIHVGDTGPKLTAGGNGGSDQCRVCHSVAAQGSRLIAVWGNDRTISSAYDLSPTMVTENILAHGAEFPGMYPDGSLALSEAGQIMPLPDDTNLVTPPGLAAVATDVGTPAFAPDGKSAVFNPMSGPGVTAPGQELIVMKFDLATMTFSNPKVVVDDTGQPADTRPGWPAFTPDGKSVVFEHQSVHGADGNGSGALWTRKGAKGQLAWTTSSDATHVAALTALNGGNYLPKLAAPIAMSCIGDGVEVGNIDADHGDDVDLNYEPTVNPIASGGYAWVVFTSRRMYGSVANIPPFCSDPRGVDLVQNITPKKLWVAAIDLSAPPGSDASHPAFYMPGQELLAGNSRGFWVLDPCKMDGADCMTGDQCCNGYCEPDGNGGTLVCSNKPNNGSCSGEQEHCDSASDCCNSNDKCINGFCTVILPH